MNWFTRLIGPSAEPAAAAPASAAPVEPTLAPAVSNAITADSSDRQAMSELFNFTLSTPGAAPVTDRTAMQVGTVFACLSKLSGAITQLPIHHYRKDMATGDRERVVNSALWTMLNESPSDAWTAASWKEWIVQCVHLRGDQCTQILRHPSGNIIGFKVHHPDWVSIERLEGRLRYNCIDQDTGRAYGVDQDDMLHFTGYGFDGVRSMSAIRHAARQAISNALDAASFSGRTMRGGGVPKIALSYPGDLGKGGAKELRDSYAETYGPGSSTTTLPLVLTHGGDVKTLSISPVDLELLAMRKYESSDICNILGVPPIIIGDSEKTSAWGSGIEEIKLAFTTFTITPHITRWGEELNRKLFRRNGQFVEFEMDALLRGNSKSQAEFFRAALGGPGTGDGWMTVNEVRALKNLPPVTGGNVVFKAVAKPAAAAAATTESPAP